MYCYVKKTILLALFVVSIGKVCAQQVISDTLLFFATNKYTIDRKYNNLLATFAQELKEDTSAWVEISGHADITGPKAFNNTLSLKRTETVIKALHKDKVNDKKIKGFHYGSSQPIANNKTPEGRRRNRRVEIRLLKPSPVKEQVVAEAEPEKLPKRIEIDINYNKEKFAYLNNDHRTVVHTVREAELIFDTNSFVLPKHRSSLYANQQVRLDFTEMDKIGQMLFDRVGLVSTKNQPLVADYILCLDSISNEGHIHLAKGRTIELLIPDTYVKDDMSLYTSKDEDKQHWKEIGRPKHDVFHNCYVMNLPGEGCVAVAKANTVKNPVSITGSYARKSKDAKFDVEPEFYFVYKGENTIIPADKVTENSFTFKNIRNGAEGSIIGIAQVSRNETYVAQEVITVRAHHQNNTVHEHGQVKFSPVNHFELERTLLNVNKDSF